MIYKLKPTHHEHEKPENTQLLSNFLLMTIIQQSEIVILTVNISAFYRKVGNSNHLHSLLFPGRLEDCQGGDVSLGLASGKLKEYLFQCGLID